MLIGRAVLPMPLGGRPPCGWLACQISSLYPHMEPFSHLHEHSGGMPREVSTTDTQYMPGPVSSTQICSRERCFSSQLLVPSYIIIIDLCLAVLHAWTLKYQHMMLCIWWWIPTKAERQWPAGEDHWAALATSGSTRSRRMPVLYRWLRCADLRSPGVTEWHNGSLKLWDDDMSHDVT